MADPIVSGIYKIQNLVNGKRYVGSAVKFRERWYGHKRSLKAGNHHSRYLQAAWNKYGSESFVFDVLELVASKNDLLDREQSWMDLLKPAYNICKVAGSPLGVKHSDEVNMKKSLANLGKKHSEETKARLKTACVGRKPPCTPEIIEKRAQKLRGKKRPQSAIDATAASRRGSKHSEASKAKMSISRLGVARGKFSDEHRARLSQSAKVRFISKETRAKISLIKKIAGPPVLTKEQRAAGDAKRRGVKRTEEQIQRIKAGQQSARLAKLEQQQQTTP